MTGRIKRHWRRFLGEDPLSETDDRFIEELAELLVRALSPAD